MFSRLALRVAPNAALVASRRFASQTTNEFAAVGKDVCLKVVPRNVRRSVRSKKGRMVSTTGANGVEAKVVRTMSLPNKIAMGLFAGGFSGAFVWFVVLDEHAKRNTIETLSNTVLGDLYRYAAVQVEEICRPFTDPSRAKLLPDWPLPGMSPNTPPVPVLVLDLEDTLVHSEWSRKHGWRHAKRPGVDEFLETLCQYFEIVIFSHNQAFLAEEVMAKLDPKGCALHYLSRDATRYLNGAHVKDLSALNRDLRRIVLLDDDPSAYQLQPENAIPIKPYTDGRDRTDHELKDLIPFLRALGSERVKDFRGVLSEFRDEDGMIRDLPTKYGARVHALEMHKEQEKQKGLGGFLRGRLAHRPATPPTGAPAM